MPPRQGQSQLISPVSSLKAPCDAASDSRSAGDWAGASMFCGRGDLGSIEGGEAAVGCTGRIGRSSSDGNANREDRDSDSSVGRGASWSWMVYCDFPANNGVVLYQYTPPAAIAHLVALFFQLREVLCGGSVLRNRLDACDLQVLDTLELRPSRRIVGERNMLSKKRDAVLLL